MSDRLKDLADAGVSIWLDDLSRERIETGNLAEVIEKKSVVGVTTNPTIFAAAIADGERYDEQVAPARRQGRVRRPGDLRAHHRGRPQRVRHLRAARGRGVRRRPGLDRGRADPRQRHRGHHRLGARPVGGGRPVQRADQDPRHQGGAAGHHGGDRRGHQRQRHADLRQGPLPGGHGRLPVRPRGGPRRRPRPEPDPVGRVVLRVPRGHRGRQPGSTRSAPTRRWRSRARPPSPTPGSPTRAYEEVLASDRWKRPGRGRRQPAAPAVGLDRRQEPGLLRHALRHRPGRRQHRQHDAGEDHGRLRRPRRGRRATR